MPRDRLFLSEALSATERISVLADGETVESLTADATKRELDAAQRSIPEFRHQLTAILARLPDTSLPTV